jgi:hypothetical protein
MESTDETPPLEHLYNPQFQRLMRFCGHEEDGSEEGSSEEGSSEEGSSEEGSSEEGSC